MDIVAQDNVGIILNKILVDFYTCYDDVYDLTKRKHLPILNTSEDILQFALAQYNGNPVSNCLTIAYFFSNTPNIPVENTGGFGMILTFSGFIRIIFFIALSKDVYTKLYLNNGGTDSVPTWKGWEKISS